MTDITIASREEVRRLAGNPRTDRVPDAVIDSAILSADDYVRTSTRNQFWSSTDPDFNSVKMASERFAASTIRHMFDDPNDVASALFKEGTQMVDKILANVAPGGGSGTGGTGGSSDTISRIRPYQTYPLNSDADYMQGVAM